MYGDQSNMLLQQQKDRRLVEWDLVDSAVLKEEKVLTMQARSRPNFT